MPALPLPAPHPSLTRVALDGAVTAGASLGALVALSLVAWIADAAGEGSAGQAVGTGASLWAVGAGGHVASGSATISLVPLGLLAVLVAAATRGATATIGLDDETRIRARLLAWVGGHVAVGVLACLLTLLGPAPVTVLGAVLAVTLVPLLGAGLAAWRTQHLADVLDTDERLPLWVRRGIAPGLLGVGALLLVGLAVVLALGLLHVSRITHLQSALAPGVVGGALLTVLQVALVPDLALWALGVVTGAGTQLVDGARMGWGGYTGGVLPAIPVLGALPQPGRFPGWVPVLAVLPAAVGALVADRVVRSYSALAPTAAILRSVSVALVVAAGGVGLLDLVAGGALGSARLAHLGPNAALLTLATAAWLALGAGLRLGWRALQSRR